MDFEKEFNEFIPSLTQELTSSGTTDWSVKGFIDCYNNIFSISTDTKVISKIIELMIFPKFLEFATKHELTLKLSPHQNYYPDITFIDKKGRKYAVDLKSTYRTSDDSVNGMTLGAFTGYFRNRESTKNVLLPYSHYEKHFVFGIIYSRTDISMIVSYLEGEGFSITKSLRKSLVDYLNETSDEKWGKVQDKISTLTKEQRDKIDSFLIDETEVYNLNNFKNIRSVVRDFHFFLQEKWKIAKARPGSGNTKNIGSETNIDILTQGEGLFVTNSDTEEHGKELFDSYWINYETKGMAKENGRKKPNYKCLDTYKEWVRKMTV